ncbi:NAD(P)-dependent oxidoreductase [Rubellimicrobium sp. CFH 75288]|uniref:NAD(P)-dependent oxidoreductase n=1 Tax=Rubellimicrobium sp. CFH 75288 TaxID=2697034 RepID=UPI001411ECA8|nr:NAD(P)-dependent oxidoreductase [Rubellimicrobium sp. CFH 75288]NAZ37395.1 FAD-dependent oxidoreductase [Rubellimicrobium sp. CFH 75288]
MTSPQTPGIAAHRLDAARLASNFEDVQPPLDHHEARVAADRCYFCYDAPCIAACPTEIDIPLFIRQIQAGRPVEAAMTIWSQNIFGGACARVCPTEQLCEGACVREAAEGKPVEIGRLQRYATDAGMARNSHPFAREAPTGKHVAVVGAGPAGLACAHRLAMRGHDVVVFEKRPKPGGLNEYGIAAYKVPGDFAQAEVDWLLGIGGIEIRCGVELGRDVTLDQLRAEYDAVFLGIGLQDTNALGVPGENRAGVEDAVDFIERLRQTPDKGALPVGRSVVVIGGGMTAVDAAVQSRALGAETVTIVYRRGQEAMSASRHEQEHAQTRGVRIMHEAAPREIRGNGAVSEVAFAYTEAGPDGLRLREAGFRLEADQVLKAIGQRLGPLPEGLGVRGGKIDPASLPAGVWVGGDCAPGGEDLTVTATAQGRDAAEAIHRHLTGPAA